MDLSQLNLKKFEGSHTRYDDRISITKSQSLGFPMHFCKKFNIKEFKYCSIFFDKEQFVLGVCFTNSEDEVHKFKLLHSDKYGVTVNITSFFRAQDIEAKDYAGKYKWEKKSLDGVGEIFIFQLMRHAVSNIETPTEGGEENHVL